MKIYKIAQNKPSPSVWIAQELLNSPNMLITSTNIKTLLKWIDETNPNLNNFTIISAIEKAFEHQIDDEPIESLKPENITIKNKEDMATSLIENMGLLSPNLPTINPNDIKITRIINPIPKNDPKFMHSKMSDFFVVEIEFNYMPQINPSSQSTKRYASFLTKDGEIFILKNIKTTPYL